MEENKTTCRKFEYQTQVRVRGSVSSQRNECGTLRSSPVYFYTRERHKYYTFVQCTRVSLTLSLHHSKHRLHRPGVYSPQWGSRRGSDCIAHRTLSHGEEECFAMFDHVLMILKDKISILSYFGGANIHNNLLLKSFVFWRCYFVVIFI